jgi:hypothetical protein
MLELLNNNEWTIERFRRFNLVDSQTAPAMKGTSRTLCINGPGTAKAMCERFTSEMTWADIHAAMKERM